jgi:hypothetical protein
MGIPIDRLVFTNESQGGNDERGTWAHPRVAHSFAMWCSPAFEVQVTEWIEEVRTTGGVTNRQLPASAFDLIIAQAQASKALEERVSVLEDRDRERAARESRRLAETSDRLLLSPAPTSPPPPRSLRADINTLIRNNSFGTNGLFDQRIAAENWNRLYREFRDREHFDLKRRARNSGEAPLDIAKALRVEQPLYNLAYALWPPRDLCDDPSLAKLREVANEVRQLSIFTKEVRP